MEGVPQDVLELFDLLQRMMDESLTAEQHRRLEELLTDHPDLQTYYSRFFMLSSELRFCQSRPEPQQCPLDLEGEEILSNGVGAWDLPSSEDVAVEGSTGASAARGTSQDIDSIKAQAEQKLLRFLAEQEEQRRASRSPIRPKPQRPPINIKAVGARVNTVLIWMYRGAVASALAVAAVLAIVIGIDVYKANRIVARLSFESNAQWAKSYADPDLRPGRMRLEKGFARIILRRGAEVIIQAPSVFDLQSPNRMFIESGWVTAKVPPRAHGFTIGTPGMDVVDFGTEFGLRVGSHHQFELHVFDGAVEVHGSPDLAKPFTEERVAEGRVVRRDRDGRMTHYALEHRPALFIREITQIQGAFTPAFDLDLADVVGGGNGFGAGYLGYAINPVTGSLVSSSEPDHTLTTGAYVPVSWSDFIDGVFVPDGRTDQIVSTQGHVFRECPITDRYVLTHLQNGGLIRRPFYQAPMVWGEETLGTRERPCLLMHTNLGITFDLKALQDSVRGFQAVRFRARFGVSEHSERRRDYASDSEFWVLVDEEVRFHRKVVAQKGLAGSIDIPLDRNSRFLTLITSDAGDAHGSAGRWSAGDWCLFTEPVLELEWVENTVVSDG